MYRAEIDVNPDAEQAVASFWYADHPFPFVVTLGRASDERGEWSVSDSSDADPTFHPTWEDALDAFREQAAACVRDDGCA